MTCEAHGSLSKLPTKGNPVITRELRFISDTQSFDTLDAAIGHELALIFPDSAFPPPTVETILKNRDRIVDLLTTTATSKNKARRVNGGTKKRTPRPAADNAAINRALQDGDQ